MSRRQVWIAALGLALLPATAPASAALAQQTQGRAFTLDDALGVRSARIEDVSLDGRWIALTTRLRPDGFGVNHGRFGDPTYLAPALSEFTLMDATTGKSQAILPGKVDVRVRPFPRTGAGSHSFRETVTITR